MVMPKVGAAVAAAAAVAAGAAVPPKGKPVELAPKAGLAGVPKVQAVVLAAPAPKEKGAGVAAGAALGAATAAAVPKPNGLGAAVVRPGNAAGAGAALNADLAKVKVDWVVGALRAAVVPAAVVVPTAAADGLAKAKPPKEAVGWLGAGAAWPKPNMFWGAALVVTA